MPVTKTADDFENLALFGENIRAERRLRRWSIRKLAHEARVCPDTVFRIEHGLPSTFKRRERLCGALEASYRRLMMSAVDSGPGYAIHREEGARWTIHYADRPYRPPADEEDRIQDEKERVRLGRLGFVRHFVHMLNCRLPRGRLLAGVLELYGKGTKENYAGGEVLVYVLSGSARVVFGEESFIIRAGESATIECGREDFCFEPADEASGEPATVLYVRLDDGSRER